MIIRSSLLALSLCCALVLIARAQNTGDPLEEDYHVTKAKERLSAVETLRAKSAEYRQAGQLVAAARTLNRVGQFQIRMSVAQDAVATFQEAMELLDQQPNVEARIDSLNGLASSYDNLSKCNLVEPLANQAITLSKQNNYVAGQADALLILSDCQNLNDHALALDSARQALELWRSIDRKRGMAEAERIIGHFQMALNNLPESAASFQAALSLYHELNAGDQESATLTYLGFIEYRKGAWQSALAYYTQAQSRIDEKAEPYEMGRIAGGLGEVFLESGLPDVALGKFREALEFFRLSKNQRAITALNLSIGKAQYLSGHYQEGLDSLQTALNESRANNDATLVSFCEDFLGRAYYSIGDLNSALSHFQAALDGYESTKNPMEAARIKALMGQVYEQRGDIRRARSDYQTALETFHRLSDVVNESATLYALGRAELGQDNLAAAENYLQQSIEITDQMRRSSTSSDLTAAISATVQERYESYIDCMMQKHQAEPLKGYAEKAFEISELGRARSLAELLRATQTNLLPGLDPQLAEEEKSLRQSLKVKEDAKVAFLAKPYRKEDLEAIDSELAGLETQYKQVSEKIRSSYPAYDQVTRPVSWDLNEIQERVIADDQTVLLEYSLGAERSYVWAVTRNGIASHELPSQTKINEAAQKVYGLLTIDRDPQNDNELIRATQELSQIILTPVAGELNKQRVIVVADGALNYIPFQILPASSASDEPLVASAEIINAPSASILGQLREETARRRAPTKVLAAFGDAVFASNYAQRKEASAGEYVAVTQSAQSEGWRHALRDIEPEGDSVDPATIQPLFYSKLELANLRDVAGPESFVATGFDASREKLAGADLTKYAILHFATHGALDPKQPEKSGLLLSTVDRNGKAQNGFVGLQDVYALHAPVDLVVLSACRTGLGKDVRGEGLIGLTRGFMYAGASSVVASLWKVDDEATAELMKRFYTNMLQRGMTPAAALRAAQNSIRQEPQWRSPYFWAAFTLQGEYRRSIHIPAKSISRLQIGIALSVLLLFFAGAAWWYRRAAGQTIEATLP